MARSGTWAAGAVAAVGLLIATTAPAAAAEIYWADWLGTDTCTGACFTGQGTITTPTTILDPVSVTYHNDLGVGFYNTGAANEEDYWTDGAAFSNSRDPLKSPYTSTAVDNIPTGTDMIALRFAGPQTLTFSQTIANPVFAFVSLNGNGYSFLNQDFDILSIGGEDGNDCGYWGCGGVTKVVVAVAGGTEYRLNSSNVGGTEPHGVIRFKGAFDTLTWRSTSDEYWNGFTVGVQGTAKEVFPDDQSVPEPASMMLLGTGLVALAARLRRRA